MAAQATYADPQFKKMSGGSYVDADFAGFSDAAAHLQATALKIKDFSKGPDFDALAMRLYDQARALDAAAQAKDGAAARTTLAAMKATCKECHKKFR